jgi:hypothetical protein
LMLNLAFAVLFMQRLLRPTSYFRRGECARQRYA